MVDPAATVIVIDDDQAVREALDGLLRSVGWRSKTYVSVEAFLSNELPLATSCLVLDVRLPGQSGLDLQQELLLADVGIPIIFISGHADVPMSVRAMKSGAVEFLTKPFRDQDLIDAIQAALKRDAERRQDEAGVNLLRERHASLSRREQQILAQVVTGKLNKQIAHDVGISEITVKVHRGQVMRKMQADSLAQLVRMAGRLQISAGDWT